MVSSITSSPGQPTAEHLGRPASPATRRGLGHAGNHRDQCRHHRVGAAGRGHHPGQRPGLQWLPAPLHAVSRRLSRHRDRQPGSVPSAMLLSMTTGPATCPKPPDPLRSGTNRPGCPVGPGAIRCRPPGAGVRPPGADMVVKALSDGRMAQRNDRGTPTGGHDADDHLRSAPFRLSIEQMGTAPMWQSSPPPTASSLHRWGGSRLATNHLSRTAASGSPRTAAGHRPTGLRAEAPARRSARRPVPGPGCGEPAPGLPW